MLQKTLSYKVYTEFFTNLAVAWFTAGIIVPGITQKFDVTQLQGVGIATTATLLCLKLATRVSKKGAL